MPIAKKIEEQSADIIMLPLHKSRYVEFNAIASNRAQVTIPQEFREKLQNALEGKAQLRVIIEVDDTENREIRAKNQKFLARIAELRKTHTVKEQTDVREFLKDERKW